MGAGRLLISCGDGGGVDICYGHSFVKTYRFQVDREWLKVYIAAGMLSPRMVTTPEQLRGWRPVSKAPSD